MAKKKTYMDRTLNNMKGWNAINKSEKKAAGVNPTPKPVSPSTSKILKDKAGSAKPATPHSGGLKKMDKKLKKIKLQKR